MNRLDILQHARQAADRLGKETTYKEIVAVINAIPKRYRLGFALGFTSYISDRHIQMSEEDELKFYSLNLQIRELWLKTR